MKGKNRYSIKSNEILIENYAQIISSLYLPLCGKDGCSLYLLLTGEKDNRYEVSLERLCVLLQLNIEELEKAFKQLEQFNLLKSYYSKKDESFLFILQSPLSGNSFFNHELFSRMYLNKVGTVQFELSRTLFCNNKVDIDDYKEVTSALDLSSLNNWSQSDENAYQKAKNKDIQEDLRIDFDYEKFLHNLSNIVMPVSLRSKENMIKIGQLATMFSISPQVMRKLVGRCISIDEGKLDFDLLRQKCLDEKSVDYREAENPYSLNPVSYLYAIQKVPVSSPDKKLLEYLELELKLKPEVINVLIDITLKNTNNKFERGYVEKVATSWVRSGVDSLEKALEMKEAPQYKPKNKASFTEEEMKLDKQDIDDIRAQLFGKSE